MNQLIAKVREIHSVENLHLLSFDFQGIVLKMMSLEIGADVKVGKEVLLTMKPTHLIVSKNDSHQLSISNHIPATITSIERGKLLSAVKVGCRDMTLESIMIAQSVEDMALEVGDDVTIMIAESELSILKVL